MGKSQSGPGLAAEEEHWPAEAAWQDSTSACLYAVILVSVLLSVPSLVLAPPPNPPTPHLGLNRKKEFDFLVTVLTVECQGEPGA